MERWLRRVVAFIGCLFCLTPAFADLIVGDLTLVSQKRVGRASFEYVYQAQVTNTGTALEQNATATVASSSPNTVVVEDTLTVGNVAAGTTVTTSDTFTIRQDRRTAFDPSVLTYTFSASAPPPTVTSFSPLSASIGGLITIAGSDLVSSSGAAPIVTMSRQGGGTINAPVTSFNPSSIEFTVPSAAATGSLLVSVDNQSASSTESLEVVASSDFSLTAAPNAVSVIEGKTTTIAVSIDTTSNYSQLASLALTGLPAGMTATFDPAQVAAGQTSTLTVAAPSGQQNGVTNLTVSATAIVDGINLNQSAAVALTVEPVTTTFMGRTVITSPEQPPLPGVTITMLGVDGSGNTTGCSGTTVSDGAGNFALMNLPPECIGGQLVRYDGSTVDPAIGKFDGVDLFYEIQANQVTESPVLVPLPNLDNAETVFIIQDHMEDQTVAFQSIPGLAVTVYSGTTLTMKDGSQPDPFPLTVVEIPVDRLPDAMPPESDIAIFFVSFQPANTTASQPVAVTFPNTINTFPGTNMALMTLNPTKGIMEPYGTGTVSNDGVSIIPDLDPENQGHRYGLVHFDWHAPQPPPPPEENPCPCNPKSGSPVSFESGIETWVQTDLAIPAPGGGVAITRTYRTKSNNVGPFGIGAFHDYSYGLNIGSPSKTTPLIGFRVPAGNQFPFANRGDGTFVNVTEPTMRGAVLTVNADSSTDLRFKDGTTYHFISGPFLLGSLLESISDPNGNKTTLVRNPANPSQITEVIDSVGRKLKLTYDTSNRITQIVDPIGRVLLYAYSPNGMLETFTDPEGGVWRYEYQFRGTYLTKVINPNGVIQVQNDYGQVYVFTTTETPPTTVQLTDTRIVKQTFPDGGIQTYTYETLVNPSSPFINSVASIPTDMDKVPVVRTFVRDPRGNATTYRFQPSGSLSDIVDPVGQRTIFVREPTSNQMLSIQGSAKCEFCGDIGAGDIEYTYDENGNILTEKNDLGNVVTTTFDLRFNLPLTITDELGNSTRFTYDVKGNLLTVTDPNGNQTSTKYNNRGLQSEIIDSLGNKTILNYDAFGNLIKRTDATGIATVYRYDAIGRLLEIIDSNNNSLKFAFDNLDRLVSEVDAQGNGTDFNYDAVGNLLSVTDAHGNTTTYTYDSMNRPTVRTDPLVNSNSRAYDLNGNLVSLVDRQGKVIQYQYDELNRLVRENYDDGNTVDRSYDMRGRLVNVVDSAYGTTLMVYDQLGRLLREVGPDGALTYTYDALGRVTSRQVAGLSLVNYTYDPVGNLLGVNSPEASVNFTYDSLNRRTNIQRSNAVDSVYTYDELNRALSIVHYNGTQILNSQVNTYDNNGNRKSYDTDFGSPLITQPMLGQYDVANRLLHLGNAIYTYDNNGNRVTKTTPAGVTNYIWDARNRLTSVTEPNGTTTLIEYDTFGNLAVLSKTDSTSTTIKKYLTDDLTNTVLETSNKGEQFAIISGRAIDDHLALVDANGDPEFLLRDVINSTVATVDNAGIVSQTLHYEPFGQAAVQSSQLFQFTGRIRITDSLYYYRSRFYDTDSGQFISEDTIGFAGGGTNLYAYAAGNPVNYVDPTGRAWVWVVVKVVARSGVTAFVRKRVWREITKNSEPACKGDWCGGGGGFSGGGASGCWGQRCEVVEDLKASALRRCIIEEGLSWKACYAKAISLKDALDEDPSSQNQEETCKAIPPF